MKRLGGLVLAGALALPACTVGPDYTRPVVTTPDAWYEAHVQGIAVGDLPAELLRQRPDVALPAALQKEADEERLFSIPPSEG